MKKDKKQKSTKEKVGLFKCIRVTVPFIIKSAPWLFVISCLVLLCQAFLESLQIYVLEDMFNGITELANGNTTVIAVMLAILLWAGLYMASVGLLYVTNYVDEKFGYTSANAQLIQCCEKMARLEPIIFEHTDKLDDIEKATNGRDRSRDLLNIIKSLVLFTLPYLVIVSIYLIKREPLLVVAMVLIFAPTMVQQWAVKKLYTEKEDKQAPLRRKQGYYAECITDPKYYKETRLLGGYRFFIKNFRDLLTALIKLDLKTGIKKELLFFCTTFISLTGRLVVYYMLFRFLMNGRISVGEFAAVFSSLGVLEGQLHNLFYNTFSSVSEGLPYIENYVRFLNFPEMSGKEVDLGENIEISLKDVKFAYPNQTGNALDGVSFDVKPKETVAIVGENGSGKSTLIKLITGYYKPSEGEVKLNGNDTRDTSFPSVAKRLSAVFQRYPHYAMTLRENLAIGDISKEPTDEALRKACAMSGFSPEEKWLPNGFDTMLSREFDDGVGLSGGQIQRIAIARAFYRDSSIIILDEPTAAIDPIEEARIYGRFAELSKDKTSFIVTHRLASVKIADRIIMMKNGKAVEIGTHDELMALDGEYKKMYDSQRQWYESNDDEKAPTQLEAENV